MKAHNYPLAFIIFSISFLFIGLIFYGKALALNQEAFQLKTEIKALKQETQRLSLSLKQQKNLARIENYARENLDMVPIEKIHYLSAHE